MQKEKKIRPQRKQVMLRVRAQRRPAQPPMQKDMLQKRPQKMHIPKVDLRQPPVWRLIQKGIALLRLESILMLRAILQRP